MRLKMLLIAGSAGLLLLGCSSPRGGADESNLEGLSVTNQPLVTQEQSQVNTNEGIAPRPMSTPNKPSGMNPRDLRDPQAVTIPGPPLGPRP